MRHPDLGARRLPVRPAHFAATTSCLEDDMSDDTPLGPDLIDGSLAGVRAFLAEMAQLVDGGAAEPVLELLFDGILTCSAVSDEGEGGLAIFAFLPRSAGAQACGIDAALSAEAAKRGYDCLWHAEQGCLVLARTVPLGALRDEPGVLDAIMETAQYARRLVLRSGAFAVR